MYARKIKFPLGLGGGDSHDSSTSCSHAVVSPEHEHVGLQMMLQRAQSGAWWNTWEISRGLHSGSTKDSMVSWASWTWEISAVAALRIVTQSEGTKARPWRSLRFKGKLKRRGKGISKNGRGYIFPQYPRLKINISSNFHIKPLFYLICCLIETKCWGLGKPRCSSLRVKVVDKASD